MFRTFYRDVAGGEISLRVAREGQRDDEGEAAS